MNPIIDIQDELEAKLEGRLKNDADSQDIVSTIAAIPKFSLGAHPRSATDAASFVTAAEEKLNEVAEPQVRDERDFELIRREIAATIESHLLEEYVPDREFLDHGWEDEIKYLLRDYPPHYRCKAALHIGNLARFETDPDIPDGVVDPLVSNLTFDDPMVRRTSARALADLADAEPNRLVQTLSQIVCHVISGDQAIRTDLLYALTAISESASASDCVSLVDDDVKTIVRTAQYTLVVYSGNRVHVLATRLLAALASIAPEIVKAAAHALWTRLNDPHPAIGDRAQEALQKLSDAGVLDKDAITYNPDELLSFVQNICEPSVVSVNYDNIEVDLADQGLNETRAEQGTFQSKLPFYNTENIVGAQ